MNTAAHIFERAVIHLVCAPTLYVIAVLGYRFLDSRWPKWTDLSVPAVIVFMVVAIREPFDVASGQGLVKLLCDYVSWGAGLGLGVWGLAKLKRRGIL